MKADTNREIQNVSEGGFVKILAGGGGDRHSPAPHPTRGNPAAKFVQPGKNPIFLALFNLECLRSVLMVKEVC